MSTFDPLTYSMAREAKLPAGALLPSMSADPTLVSSGWAHLDGSLVSRAQYPNARNVLGDVRFFDGTPVETNLVLTTPANANVQGSQGKVVIVGNTILMVPALNYSPSGKTLRVWRSTNGGETWNTTDLAQATSITGNSVNAELLEWFGGGRLLLVVRIWNSGANTSYFGVTVSSDLGGNWTPLVAINNGWNLSNLHASSDAQMVSSGQGYYYLAGARLTSPATGDIWAVHPVTGAVKTAHAGGDAAGNGNCELLGGRVTAAGASEVLIARVIGGVMQAGRFVFDGNTFTPAASGVAYNSNYFRKARLCLVRGGDGQDYVAVAGSDTVYRMPPNWTGTPVPVHTGLNDTAGRMLTNTLSNPLTGLGFDLTTGAETRLSGFNAGANKIGAQYGTAAKEWALADGVTDRTPSTDRHFLQISSQAGSFAVRSLRCASNFMGAFQGTADAARFATYNTTQLARFYDANTGVMKAFSLVSRASTYDLRISTYAPAQDYSNYLHLPYLPGLVCRLR